MISLDGEGNSLAGGFYGIFMSEIDVYMRDAFGTLLTTHGESREGGESLVYRFRAGSTRTINGVVDRNPPASLDANGTMIAPLLIISLHHDSTLGVLHTEIDAGDQIDVAVKKGGTVTTRTVKKVNDPDAGTITLEVV